MPSANVGQIAVFLGGRGHAVTDEEVFIDQIAEIVGLHGNAAGGLAVEKSGKFDRCDSPAAEIAHEEFGGNAGVENSFEEKHVLVAEIDFVAEENFDEWGVAVLVVLPFGIVGFDELADEGDLEAANQVGHEDEAVFEDAEDVEAFALVIVGDLARHFLDALLNLLFGDDWADAAGAGSGRAWCLGHGCFLFLMGGSGLA